jgi:hypothetical protein
MIHGETASDNSPGHFNSVPSFIPLFYLYTKEFSKRIEWLKFRKSVVACLLASHSRRIRHPSFGLLPQVGLRLSPTTASSSSCGRLLPEKNVQKKKREQNGSDPFVFLFLHLIADEQRYQGYLAY